VLLLLLLLLLWLLLPPLLCELLGFTLQLIPIQ
jgi:hypothetical protein